MRDRTASVPTLRVDLTLPSTRLGLGPLSYDPLKELLGIDPGQMLARLLRSEPYTRTTGGVATEVFPLALAPGMRVAIPLGSFGELAVANERGLLELTVPAQATRWLQDQVGGLLVAGPKAITDDDGVHRGSVAWLRLPPGARAAFPLGLLGELGLEAV